MHLTLNTIVASVLALGTFGAYAEDVTNAFANCAVMQNDKQRLACYDGIRDRVVAQSKGTQTKSGAQQIALSDLKTDMKELVGKRVVTAGKIQVLGGVENVFLKTDEMDMAPVMMNAEGLPRDDRKKLLNGCQMILCKGVVTGRVRRGPLGPEFVAESVNWQ